MKKIKFGIAGLGRMGSIHLENLVNKFNDIELVAISDINPNIKELAKKYSIPNFYNNYQKYVIALADLIQNYHCNQFLLQ